MISIIRSYFICAFLCATYSIKAQNIHVASDPSEYRQEALEYERQIFENQGGSDVNELLLKKALTYKYANDFNEAHLTLKRLNPASVSSDKQIRIYYEKILIAYLSSNYSDAQFELLNMRLATQDTLMDQQILLLKILVLNELQRWPEAKIAAIHYIKRYKLNIDAEKLYGFLKKPVLKKQRKAEILYTFIPSAGFFYAGYPGKGFINLGLMLTFAAFGVYNVVEGYYITSFFAGFAMTQVFYLGGQRYTDELIIRKNKEITKKHNERIKASLLNALKSDN